MVEQRVSAGKQECIGLRLVQFEHQLDRLDLVDARRPGLDHTFVAQPVECIEGAISGLLELFQPLLHHASGIDLPGCRARSAAESASPPVDLGTFPVQIAWHVRHRNDPAHRWLRGLIGDVARELERSYAFIRILNIADIYINEKHRMSESLGEKQARFEPDNGESTISCPSQTRRN